MGYLWSRCLLAHGRLSGVLQSGPPCPAKPGEGHSRRLWRRRSTQQGSCVKQGHVCMLLLAEVAGSPDCAVDTRTPASTVAALRRRSPLPAGHSHRPVSWLQLPQPEQALGQSLSPRGGGRAGSRTCSQPRVLLPLWSLTQCHGRRGCDLLECKHSSHALGDRRKAVGSSACLYCLFIPSRTWRRNSPHQVPRTSAQRCRTTAPEQSDTGVASPIHRRPTHSLRNGLEPKAVRRVEGNRASGVAWRAHLPLRQARARSPPSASSSCGTCRCTRPRPGGGGVPGTASNSPGVAWVRWWRTQGWAR